MIERWFAEYGDDIYRYLVYTQRTSDVEDLVQETFVRAMDSLFRGRRVDHPRAFLLRIARNLCIDAARRRKAWLRLAPRLRDDAAEASHEQAVVLDAWVADVLARLERANRAYHDVVVLRGLQGLSSEEAAHVLGWTPNHVNVAYHRALKLLRSLVASEGGEQACMKTE